MNDILNTIFDNWYMFPIGLLCLNVGFKLYAIGSIIVTLFWRVTSFFYRIIWWFIRSFYKTLGWLVHVIIEVVKGLFSPIEKEKKEPGPVNVSYQYPLPKWEMSISIDNQLIATVESLESTLEESRAPLKIL